MRNDQRCRELVLLRHKFRLLAGHVWIAARLTTFGWIAISIIGGMAMAEDRTSSPTDAIIRLFAETPIRAEWFTNEFVAAAPPSRIQSIIEGLVSDFGMLVDVQLDGRVGTIRLEDAIVPVEISLDGTGRIGGLLFQPPQPTGTDAISISEAILDAVTGNVAVMAAEQGSDGLWQLRVAHNADEPMAVGSAFKLAVLQAYEDAIASGALNRADVVSLRAEDRSLPSGVLQVMQPGVPITLETLAGLMIQQSDNTATDALIRILGRANIEAMSPRNQPFLTTGEFFRLIASDGDAARSRFMSGNADERRDVLADIAKTTLPRAERILPRATWAEAEWYFTAAELCELLSSLRNAPALSGLPDPLVAIDGWDNVGFKGGSEFGVLNLSAIGTTPCGKQVCAIISANANEALPEERIALLFGAFFSSLAHPSR
ncbi:serine hydrolase [Cognatiyoonia sp. IB215446]|uniref:serine hydrolase n=1 Tax=Cognatiyoonia sp. IB215446 TaxID=3097355 RepID=UPI002A1661C2|nr:serine hydrolase [Cognatiyoonia sp. IB215446]MDX8349799.1 serine hydrolase [Cognatiyoonia sp. IB215446]